MMLKSEIRIIGIDDSPFDKFDRINRKVLVIGTIFRGGNFMDGLVSCYVTTDGDDGTDNLINMINACKFKKQLRAIMLKGIAVAGFNMIDVEKLSSKTKLPIIIVMRKFPDIQSMYDAIRFLKIDEKSRNKKLKIMTKMTEPVKFNNIYFQNISISEEKAKELLKITSTHSFIPEPIRVAHLIASGIVKGESRGNA